MFVLIHVCMCVFVFILDEFILDGVVNTNDAGSDVDTATTHARPFGESSFSAVISKGTSAGLHNAYIAVGTFASAIFIVAIVVSILLRFFPSVHINIDSFLFWNRSNLNFDLFIKKNYSTAIFVPV